jgi:hypothetical protein
MRTRADARLRPSLAGGLLALILTALFMPQPQASARSHSSKAKPSASSQEELLEAGLAAIAAGHHAQAEQTFLRAYGAEVRPELLFYLGRLAAAQGNGLLARDLMRRYLQDPDREASSSRQATAQLLLEEPPPQGIQLVETQVIGPRGAWVRIDGRLVGWLPLLSPLQLTAGAHTVALEGSSVQLSTPVLLTPGFESEVRFNAGARSVLSSAPPPLLALLSVSDASGLQEKKVFSTLRDAASQEGLFLLSRQEALQSAANLSSCLATLPCQLDLGSRNDALGVLVVRVEMAGAPREQASVHTEFLDIVAGRSLAQHTQSCSSCRDSELQELVVQTALRSYRAAWLRPRARLQIAVSTPGATVQVAGRQFLHLPLRLAPLPGSLSIEAQAPGHQPKRRSVELTAGQATNVELALEPGSAPLASVAAPSSAGVAPVGSKPSLRSNLLFFGGLGLVGTGLILGGFGISALSVHGRCGSSPASSEICPMVFDTAGKGGALLGVGLGLTVVGTVGIILGRDAIHRGRN